jgi:hypothetical protein
MENDNWFRFYKYDAVAGALGIAAVAGILGLIFWLGYGAL